MILCMVMIDHLSSPGSLWRGIYKTHGLATSIVQLCQGHHDCLMFPAPCDYVQDPPIASGWAITVTHFFRESATFLGVAWWGMIIVIIMFSIHQLEMVNYHEILWGGCCNVTSHPFDIEVTRLLDYTGPSRVEYTSNAGCCAYILGIWFVIPTSDVRCAEFGQLSTNCGSIWVKFAGGLVAINCPNSQPTHPWCSQYHPMVCCWCFKMFRDILKNKTFP